MYFTGEKEIFGFLRNTIITCPWQFCILCIPCFSTHFSQVMINKYSEAGSASFPHSVGLGPYLPLQYNSHQTLPEARNTFRVVSVMLVLSPLIFKNLVLGFDAEHQPSYSTGNSWEINPDRDYIMLCNISAHVFKRTRGLYRGLGTKLTLPKVQL